MFNFLNNANQLVERQLTALDTFISGNEFRVNTYTTNAQAYHSAAALSTGGFVVTWQSTVQDGDSGGIYGQIYDSSGNTRGNEFQVNTYTTLEQTFPSVAGLTNGGFVVTWDGRGLGEGGALPMVYGQRYDNAGSALGGNFQVNTYTVNTTGKPFVASLNNGGFVVAWQSTGQDGDSYGIYAQRYDSQGATSGSEFQVNSYTTAVQFDPAVVSLTQGGFVIAWTSDLQDGSNYGIYAQRYDNAGSVLGSEFKVNTYITNHQQRASVAALANGGFLVVWASMFEDGDNSGIYGQRYDGAGATIGGEFQVNTYTTDYQGYASTAALIDGSFVVVWASAGQDGDGYGIYAQYYNPASFAVGNEFQVNTHITSDQIYPFVAALISGGFVVSWTSNYQDGDNAGIYAKIFTPVASPSPTPSPWLNNPNILFIALGLGAVTLVSLAAFAYTKYRSRKLRDSEKLDAEMEQVLNPTPRSEKVKSAKSSTSQILARVNESESENPQSREMSVQPAVTTSPRQYDNLPPATIKTPRGEEGRTPSGSVVSILPASNLIPYNQLTFGKVLGQGAYGVVYQGSWQHSDVAIKQLLLTSLSEKAKAEIEKEAEVMAGLRHANVVTFYGASIDHPGKYSLVMELMPLGNLFNALHNNQPLAWDVRLSIAKDITAGLEHLHSKGILHRDLKSLNVLLGYGMRAKLTDFGLAKIKSETASKTAAEGGGSKGTTAWKAPEQFRREYTAATDIYSYGMVLWELASRAIPYEDATDLDLIRGWIKDGIQETIPEDCPPKLGKLIKWCWEKDPSARPTTAQAAEELKPDETLQVETPDNEPNYHENLNTEFGL